VQTKVETLDTRIRVCLSGAGAPLGRPVWSLVVDMQHTYTLLLLVRWVLGIWQGKFGGIDMSMPQKERWSLPVKHVVSMFFLTSFNDMTVCEF
jgi:hypothetical protein